MDNVHQFSCREEIEEQAADWLARLDGDRLLSKAEKAELKTWIDRSPAHREELRRLVGFWQQANTLTELSFPLPTSQSAAPQTQSTRHKTRALAWRGAIAAALVAGLAILLYPYKQNGGHPVVAGNGVYETRVGEQNSITLKDGSTIELNTNSRVQVNYTGSRRGIVLMQGEVHFDVSKNPERPFEVTAGHGRVRAVGTAFAVRYHQSDIAQSQGEVLQVTVTEGKVALEAISQTNVGKKNNNTERSGPATASGNTAQLLKPITRGSLIAGQSAAFQPQAAEPIDSAIKILGKDAVERALAWRDGLLLFSGEPLTEVVKEMNRYTETRIEIADPDIAQLSIGGQFKVGNTNAMLRALEVSFGIEARSISHNHIQLVKARAP
jgi:transmembrane sensor